MARNGPTQLRESCPPESQGGHTDDCAKDKGPSRRKVDDPFPPRWKWWEWVILLVLAVTAVACLSFLVVQFFSPWTTKKYNYLMELSSPSALCLSYCSLIWILMTVVVWCWRLNRIVVHNRQIQDLSAVEALILEAEYLEPRLGKKDDPDEKKKPNDYAAKKADIQTEVGRLRDLGNRGWTAYQVLSLEQQLVDFLKVDDLIATAQVSLDNLEEYAEDSARRYDWECYSHWEQRIKEGTEDIEEAEKSLAGPSNGEEPDERTGANSRDPTARDHASEKLRANLRTLMEHVVDYETTWTEGSAIISGIMICGFLAIPLLLVMGLLPVLHPGGDDILGVLNWAVLGAAGAFANVLLSLRKSNVVDVGDAEGRKELLRTILSAPLGFGAGVLAYCLIAGGVVPSGNGGLVPDVVSGVDDPRIMALSVLWAFGAGHLFERVFDRVLSATVGRGG